MKAQRPLSLFLAALMLAATACGSQTDNNKDDKSTDTADTSVNTEATRLTELGAKDFGDEDFNILDANSNGHMHINMPGEEMTGETVSVELYKRDLFIEQNYNINVEWSQIAPADAGCDVIRQCVLTGDGTYDLMFSHLPNNAMGALANEGLLHNLSANPYISLDEPWWSSMMADSLRVGDRVYYTTGDISPTIYQMAACVYVNPTLCKTYGIEDDFFEIVRNGKWTYDYIFEITKDKDRDINNDNVMHANDDFFGLASFKVGISDVRRMMVSQGVSFTELNEDGDLVANYNTERALKAMDNIKKVFSVNIQYNDHREVINNTFAQDRALMFFGLTEYAYVDLRDMNTDYIMLPMPKFDEVQDSYRTLANAFACAYVAIPKTADTDRAGFIAEAMAYYSYKNIRPVAYEENFKMKAARDEDSFEMLDLMFDTLYIDFGTIFDFGGQQGTLQSIAKGSQEFASAIASIESAVQAEITDFEQGWLEIEE